MQCLSEFIEFTPSKMNLPRERPVLFWSKGTGYFFGCSSMIHDSLRVIAIRRDDVSYVE